MAYYDLNHQEVPYETNNWGEKILARDAGGYYAESYGKIKYYQQDTQGNTLYNGPKGSAFTVVDQVPSTATPVATANAVRNDQNAPIVQRDPTTGAAIYPNSSTSTGSSSGGSNTIGGVDISNLPPELQQTLQGINAYLTKLQANGQIVNPNLDLTPEKLAEFTAQAQNEINPYYSNQLKLARENLLAGAGYSANEIAQNEQQLAKQYNLNFKQIGANAADQGFAQSGARVTAESDLATDTNNTIDAARRKLSFDTGQNERNFAQTYGGSNVPNLQIGGAPTATGGEPTLTGGTGSRSLYTLDPAIYDGLVGSQEYQQRADVKNRVSQLTGAFNSNAALTQQRALTL